MTDLAQWPILAAALGVVVVLVGVMIRWSSAKAAEATAAMEAQTNAVRSLLDAARPPPAASGNGRDPGDTGRFDIACSPDCRSEVLAAMSHLETKFERLGDRVGLKVSELVDQVQGHRVRLAVLESKAKIDRRSEDSARPAKG